MNPDISIRAAALLCVLAALGCSGAGAASGRGSAGAGAGTGGAGGAGGAGGVIEGTPTCAGEGPQCVACPRPGEDAYGTAPLCSPSGWICPAGFSPSDALDCDRDAGPAGPACTTRPPSGGCHDVQNGVCSGVPVDYVCGASGQWVCPGATIPFTSCSCFGTGGVADVCYSDAGADSREDGPRSDRPSD